VTGGASPDAELDGAATALAERAPEPAVAGNVLCGTAGWIHPSLVKSGLFYPKGMKTSKDRLAHYAAHFPFVEVDASYYTILPPDMAARWVDLTPEHFIFDVKAFPIFTGHPVDASRLPKDLREELERSGHEGRRIYPDKLPEAVRAEMERRFRMFLDVFIARERLGALLLQFPPWFQSTRKNARTIEETAERLEGIPLAVEFRHPSWVEDARKDRVFDMLRAIGASYVVVDEPVAEIGNVPPIAVVTNPELAVVRFHGQNAAAWRRGTSVAERFRYLYSPEELKAWVAPVRELAKEAKKVHAVFNNCVRNYAVLDAKGLAVLLEEGYEREEGK
jgi:uncharacterized protein YecE (DUF72 family)